MTLIKRLLKALTSGAAATVIDVLTLAALVRLSHLAAGVAAAIGCLVGGLSNFILARRWVFAARDGNPARQLALYGVLIVLGGAVLGGTIVEMGVGFGASIVAAKVVATVLVFLLWNYPISARLVFRKELAR
jgi:putative flippase GtrA